MEIRHGQSVMVDRIQKIGRDTIYLFREIGRLGLFMTATLRLGLTPPYYGKLITEHVIKIGFYSLPVVALTALFTGMVLVLQTYTGFSRFSATQAVATVVVLSMTRELGPVLCGLMVAGRVGASVAAEIATMRVTDQIDAMITLGTSPFRFMVFPRFVAALLAMPFLVIMADIIGVYGGYMVAVHGLGFNAHAYLDQTFQHLHYDDVMSGLIKAATFGGIIALISCYKGYDAGHGAKGVGRATTHAVVISSMLILIFNYILTALLFSK